LRNDVVIITGDLPETMQMAELSLKALKHVFIAKIGNLNIGQLHYLKKLAEESGVVLQLGTGYKYCSAYNMMNEATLSAKIVEIKHQLTNSDDIFTQLANDFDFVTSLFNVGISKYNVRSWNNSENIPEKKERYRHCGLDPQSPDLLHCRLECDNGCVINVTIYTIDEGAPKLEIGVITSEMIYNVDIFGAIVKKQNRSGDAIENITLENYNEKNIYDYYMLNFEHAITNNLEALRIIDKQFQNIVVANSVIERIRHIL